MTNRLIVLGEDPAVAPRLANALRRAWLVESIYPVRGHAIEGPEDDTPPPISIGGRGSWAHRAIALDEALMVGTKGDERYEGHPMYGTLTGDVGGLDYTNQALVFPLPPLPSRLFALVARRLPSWGVRCPALPFLSAAVDDG